MSYTENLETTDPRQRLYDIQRRIQNDEDVPDEELEEGLRLLRQMRAGAQTTSASKGKPAGNSGASKSSGPEPSLDDILNGNT